ncbi:MAG: YtxH domain-containing protein [Armatimonadia bacterium]
MDKKTLIEGIAVGAVAGAIAGLLLAPKSGQETRDEISAELSEVRDNIVVRLEKLEDLTQAKYEEVVKAVMAEYAAAKKMPVDRANELEARLRDGYAAIRQTIHEHTATDESTTMA